MKQSRDHGWTRTAPKEGPPPRPSHAPPLPPPRPWGGREGGHPTIHSFHHSLIQQVLWGLPNQKVRVTTAPTERYLEDWGEGVGSSWPGLALRAWSLACPLRPGRPGAWKVLSSKGKIRCKFQRDPSGYMARRAQKAGAQGPGAWEALGMGEPLPCQPSQSWSGRARSSPLCPPLCSPAPAPTPKPGTGTSTSPWAQERRPGLCPQRVLGPPLTPRASALYWGVLLSGGGFSCSDQLFLSCGQHRARSGPHPPGEEEPGDCFMPQNCPKALPWLYLKRDNPTAPIPRLGVQR